MTAPGRAPRLRSVSAAPARSYGAVEVALDPEPAALEVLAEPGPALEVRPGSAFTRVVRPAAEAA